MWNASVICQSGIRFFYLFTYDNFFMVLSCIKNSWQYWKPLPNSVMTFLSQHIIFGYCNKKKSKPLITQNACKMKNIWLVCKKLQYSINFYSFSTTFVKFICIFENGSLVLLFWEWPSKVIYFECKLKVNLLWYASK